jgi:hypothetical protein
MSQDTSHHQDQQGRDQVPIAALHVRGQRTSEFLSIAGHELRNGLAHLSWSTARSWEVMGSDMPTDGD